MSGSGSDETLYDRLRALPEHLVGEIVDGELSATPRPGPRHLLAASVLGGQLSGPFQRGKGGPGGWWILDEPEIHLGGDVVVPDLAGWRKDRLPNLPEATYFALPPDWVCEVLSPSTAQIDVTRKLPRYASTGIPHAWLVDPANRILEVFELHDRRWALLRAYSGDDRVRAPPFESLELELAGLWPDD